MGEHVGWEGARSSSSTQVFITEATGISQGTCIVVAHAGLGVHLHPASLGLAVGGVLGSQGYSCLLTLCCNEDA